MLEGFAREKRVNKSKHFFFELPSLVLDGSNINNKYCSTSTSKFEFERIFDQILIEKKKNYLSGR